MLRRSAPSSPQKPSAAFQPPDTAGLREAVTLLTIVGDRARLEGKFEIEDSIQIECEIGGELNVGGKLVIGEKGVVRANVQTVDAIVEGQYEGNMVATGNVEITATGQVSGNIETDSLVIAKGGFFNGNVVKIKESEREKPPVYLVDEKRVGQQK
ncbi:MAG: polymer-forming cytoskeletal protein [Candidatus Methylomirabilia bacterium]